MPSASTRSIVDSVPGSGRWARATAAHRLRQQTLDGAIDWSYQLLSEHERLLWARLSVFAGGFELDAAQAVCAGDGLDAEEIPELVGSLVEKSVLKRRQGDTADRFRLLEPLRQFGRERLREAGGETSFQRRHRDWIRRLAAIAGANDARQVEAFERISVERANLWTALEFCLSDPGEAEAGAAICRDLWIYWAAQGPATDVRRVLAALLELIPAPDRSRGALLWISGLFASQSGDQSTAIRMATEALAIGQATSDPELVGWSLQDLGVAAYLEGRWDDTIAYGTESINLARTMGSRFLALSATVLLAVGRTFRGELDEGIALATDGLRQSEALGETWQRATLLQFLAVATLHRGEPAEADLHARQCLELKRDLGDLVGMARRSRPWRRSPWLWARESAPPHSWVRRTRCGDPSPSRFWNPFGPTTIAPEPMPARPWEAPAFEAAHRAGLQMTRDEVVDYALEVRISAARRPTPETPRCGRAPVAARDGSGRARRRWRHECAGGGPPVHLRADGRESSGEHLQQAGRRYPSPGRAMVREHRGARDRLNRGASGPTGVES